MKKIGKCLTCGKHINKDKITSIANINDKIKTEYERIFSTIKAPDKPKIIV